MSRGYAAVAFTDHVRDAQVTYGSRAAQARLEHKFGQPEVAEPTDNLGEGERAFLAQQDGFFLATVSDTGWPYVQFRGGPPGFVHTPDNRTVAWADFRGNRQYITVGNLGHDDRVALIFLDYAQQVRLKIYGRARVTDVHKVGHSDLSLPDYPAKVERDVHVQVTAFDWNCDQHITPRYSVVELDEQLAPLRQRLTQLELENAQLRAGT
ncbi:MAG TPA: pyridoxamine 5'-phosphate oxidase family protein [Propionibacteriaceae bacterium]